MTVQNEIVCFFSIIQIPDAPEEECVRIFVEFERIESAIKCKQIFIVIF